MTRLDPESRRLWNEFRQYARRDEFRVCCKVILEMGCEGMQLWREDECGRVVGKIHNLFLNYCPHCGNYLRGGK